jgi:hypothetical protein
MTQSINQELAYQLQMTGESENTYFLPTIKDQTDTQIEKYVSMINYTIQKQIYHVSTGNIKSLNEELSKVVRIIRNQSYSDGLKHMDLMHCLTDKK